MEKSQNIGTKSAFTQKKKKITRKKCITQYYIYYLTLQYNIEN